MAASGIGFTERAPGPRTKQTRNLAPTELLVKGLGVGGSGSDVGIAGSLVGAGSLLQGLGCLHVLLLGVVVAVLG